MVYDHVAVPREFNFAVPCFPSRILWGCSAQTMTDELHIMYAPAASLAQLFISKLFAALYFW